LIHAGAQAWFGEEGSGDLSFGIVCGFVIQVAGLRGGFGASRADLHEVEPFTARPGRVGAVGDLLRDRGHQACCSPGSCRLTSMVPGLSRLPYRSITRSVTAFISGGRG